MKYKVLFNKHKLKNMEQQSSVPHYIIPVILVRRVLLGAIIGLAIISVFVFGVPHPDPAWGEFWRIRPLVVTPLAGACAGVFYHLMGPMRHKGGWITIAGWVITIPGYFIALWLGTVLGLAGTMWH